MSDHSTTYLSQPPALKSGPSAIEQRIGEIVDVLLKTNKFTKTQQEEYSEAFTEILKAYVETPQGKKLKDLLLSKDVLPLTLTVASALLTGLVVNQQDLPNVPELNLWRDLTISAEVQSKNGKVTGVVVKFSLPLGKPPKKPAPRKKSPVAAVPAAVARQIRARVKDQELRRWLIAQAAWEAEIAGPREEMQMRRFRNWVRNQKNQDSLPSLHLMGDALAAQILEAARTNQREVIFRLTEDYLWNYISDRTGLYRCLKKLAKVVARILGTRIGGVRLVTFLVVPGIKDYKGEEIPRTTNKRYPVRIQ
jgi:hypothetical protein